MAKKLKWKRTGKIGNVIESWAMSVNYKNRDIAIGRINVFKKGVYTLDTYMFPRSEKTSMAQHSKSLKLAKRKTENWFIGLIEKLK